MVRVLNVAEKPSVAREISQILSNGRSRRVCYAGGIWFLTTLQRDGFSKYNHVFEFPYHLRDTDCEMVVTSVTGHLMETAFVNEHKPWAAYDPALLFDAPVHKIVKEVRTFV